MTLVELYRETRARLEAQHAWEEALEPGALVRVRWTNSYNSWTTQAAVVRVNRKSVRIRLTKAIVILDQLTYPVGQEFPVPRMYADGWSENNGVEPWEEGR